MFLSKLHGTERTPVVESLNSHNIYKTKIAPFLFRLGTDHLKNSAMASPQASTNASQIITHNSSSTYLYHGTTAVITLSTLLVISMILALVGNVMVIMTIIRHRGMRTRTNTLLANLAVADILVAILDMPVALITIISGDWIFGSSFCYFNGFTVGLGLMLSVQTLMWISIHKFISITRPFSRTVTPAKIVLMLVGAWSWTIFYNLTPLMGFTETVYKPGASQCGPAVPKELRQLFHAATNTLVNLVIPIIVMAYCYYRIFKEVRDHLSRMRDFADTNVRNSLIQQRHITQTLCIVLLLFLLFWTPYILYSLSLVFFGQEHVLTIFNPISYLCGYMNSACNPIIYALRSPSFRRGFKEIICRNKGTPPVGKNSQFERGATNSFGGMMVSFRRSLWRSNRKETRRRARESRAKELRAQTMARVNGRPSTATDKTVYSFSVQPFMKGDESPAPSKPLPADTIQMGCASELEGNCIAKEFSSSYAEVDAQKYSIMHCAAVDDPLSGMTINFALCSSSPDILESLDTNLSCDTPEVENILPLVVEPSSTNSIQRNVAEESSWCQHISNVPHLPQTLSVSALRVPQTDSAFLSQLMYSSYCSGDGPREAIHGQAIHVKASHKSASAGDVATLQHFLQLRDSPSPKRRHRSDIRPPVKTLEWQPSVDNLYESPWFSRRRKRHNVYGVAFKHKQPSQELMDPSVNSSSQGSNQKHFRVATLINNMKRSITDLFQGDEAEKSQSSMASSEHSLSSEAKGDRH